MSASEFEAHCLRTLRAAAPACPLVTAPQDMASYLQDWRDKFHGRALCVARPACVEEVAALVRSAAALRIGVVPQGGNTGLAGGATPSGERPQIVMSLGRMAAIRCVDRVGMTLQAEAGCVLQTARQAAADHGRMLPITFAAQGSAQIGGIISTNAGGIHALRYGTVRQQVLGLEAVLADGSVVRRMGGLRKDNAGYDWKHWLIGAEGTLAIITAAVLRLVPAPRAQCSAFVALQSPAAALALLEHLQDRIGDSLSAFELMSGASVERARAMLGVALPTTAAPWHVLVEIGDSAPAPQDRLLEALGDAMEAGIVDDAAVADSLTRNAQMWALRENITEAEHQAGCSIKHDVAVAVSAVPDFIACASAAVRALSPALKINAFGHVGDGNIHFNVIDAGAGVSHAAVYRAVHDAVVSFDGSIAAEHGIGQYRVAELVRLSDPPEMGLMHRVKRALDPENTFNPGKLLAAPGPQTRQVMPHTGDPT